MFAYQDSVCLFTVFVRLQLLSVLVHVQYSCVCVDMRCDEVALYVARFW